MRQRKIRSPESRADDLEVVVQVLEAADMIGDGCAVDQQVLALRHDAVPFNPVRAERPHVSDEVVEWHVEVPLLAAEVPAGEEPVVGVPAHREFHAPLPHPGVDVPTHSSRRSELVETRADVLDLDVSEKEPKSALPESVLHRRARALGDVYEDRLVRVGYHHSALRW
jgi:hypothetical protein